MGAEGREPERHEDAHTRGYDVGYDLDKLGTGVAGEGLGSAGTVMSAPVVRNEHGAVLGIDWRRVPGVGLCTVPGQIDVRDVMPGDRVELGGQVVTVLRVAGARSASALHVITRTDGGAEIVHEAVVGELIDVVEVGAFGS